MSGAHRRLEVPVSAWYPPAPERHFVIEQPTNMRHLPKIHIYLVCELEGCTRRLFLPEERSLRDLGSWATVSGWHVGMGSGVRCPDHRYGEPFKLEAATLDPNDTLTEEQLSEILDRMEREGDST